MEGTPYDGGRHRRRRRGGDPARPRHERADGLRRLRVRRVASRCRCARTTTSSSKPGEEAILVVQRGPTQDTNNPEEACFPGEKAENAWDAGWRNVLYVNRHLGSADADEPFCGSGGLRRRKDPGRRSARRTTPRTTSSTAPPRVRRCRTTTRRTWRRSARRATRSAPRRSSTAGATRTCTATTQGKQKRIDSWAVEESLDERYSAGFGDLSIHEHATDPDANVSYIAYYAPVRVRSRSATAGIEETGVFIDTGRQQLLGRRVLQRPRTASRLLAFSDRDFGLYILRYTGPRPGSSRRRPAPALAPRPQPAAPVATRPPARLAAVERAAEPAHRCVRAGCEFRMRVDEAVKARGLADGALEQAQVAARAAHNASSRPRA